MYEITDSPFDRPQLPIDSEAEPIPGADLDYDGIVSDTDVDRCINDDLPRADQEYVPENPQQAVIATMEGLGVEELLGDAAIRQTVLQELDPTAYKQVLNAVNGTLREQPSEQWGMDGRGYIQTKADLLGEMKAYDPPARKDREPLLDKAIEVSKTLPTEHAATLNGLAINATHVYNDGCGRASRFAYLTGTHGYDGSTEDRRLYEDALSETSGRQVVNLDPTRMDLPGTYARDQRAVIAQEYGYDGKLPTANFGGYNAMAGEESAELLTTHPDLPPTGRYVLHHVITDPYLGPNALMEHVLKSGLNRAEFIWTSQDGLRTSVNMDKLAPLLTSDDVRAIARSHRAMKRAYVEDLIDTFADPARADRAQEIVDFYRPQLQR